MAGTPAGQLSIEIIAEIAKLQSQMQQVEKTVGKMSGNVSRSAKAANDNLRNIGKGAGQGVQQFSRDVQQLKASLDPAWAATQRYKDQVALLQRALAQGAISHKQFVSEMRTAVAGYQSAGATVTKTTNAQRAGMQQLSYQLGDVATMFSMGADPMRIFASQASQVTQAVGLMTNGKKGLIAFMGGPWGQVLIGAATILGSLAAAYFGAKSEADKAKDAATDLTNAIDWQKLSVDDLIAAIDDLQKAQEKQNQTAYESERIAYANAQAALAAANAKRQEARETLELAAAALRYQQITVNQGGRGDGAAGATAGLATAGARVSGIEADIERLTKKIGTFENTVRQTSIPIIQRQVAASFDESAAAALRYDQAERQLRNNYQKGAISASEYRNELAELTRIRRADEEAAKRSGRKDRAGEREARRRAAEAKRMQREQERLEQFGERSAERIQRINERFNEQPRLIDQASQAARELDGIIVELSERKPVGFQQMIADAKAASLAIDDALVRPLEELEEASERRIQIGELVAAGRDAEAAALQEIWRLERDIGDLSEAEKDRIRDIIAYEQQRTREQQRQLGLLNEQLNVLDTAKRGLLDLFSGRSTDFFGDLTQAIKDLQGARLFDDMFGDVFDELENQFRARSPIGRANAEYAKSVDETRATTAGLEGALQDLTGSVSGAAAAIRGDMTFEQSFAPYQAVNDNGTIVVTGERPSNVGIERMSIADIADKTAAGIVGPLLAGFGDILGTKFMMQLEGVMTGALAGYIRAGTTGAFLGGAKNLATDIFGASAESGIVKGLDRALGGATTGNAVAGIGKALGFDMSSTGSQIGGALGSFIPIPGGQIIGSLAGGFLGKLFGGTKRGSATITGVDGVSTRGNSSKREDAAATLAGGIQDTIRNIAEQLDAEIGNFAVSIGIRKDNFRVDRSGRGITKTKNGAVDFGQDEAAALAYALGDAIKDGAIKGLSAAENRLLKAGNDIEKAVQDVLDFRNVFKELKRYKDPVGAAMDELNTEFERLIDLFNRAGASSEELAKLEELYGIKRAEAFEQATQQVGSALKDLLDDLRTGDNGLSLRTRRANALQDYDPLLARVRAGDRTADEEYARVARDLLDIERQIFGSTKGYFDRIAEVTSAATAGLEAGSNVSPIRDDYANPFEASAQVTGAIDSQTNSLAARLDAINDNLIRYFGSQGQGAPALHVANTVRAF